MADSQRKTANLFDGNYVKAFIDVVEYKFENVSTNANSTVIEVEPNTTYTIKKYDTSNRFLIGVSPTFPQTHQQLSMINTDITLTEITFTTDSTTNYVVVYVSTSVEAATPRLMVNTGSIALPYEPYAWQHSLRKLTTATEVVENPLYSNGTAITAYTIKGNTVQSGTPSPSNPVYPQGTGDKTTNLLDFNALQNAASGMIGIIDCPHVLELTLEANQQYTCISNGTGNTSGTADDNRSIYVNTSDLANTVYTGHSVTVTTGSDGKVKIGFFSTRANAQQYINGTAQVWFVKGSTSLSYEPYGYQISISSGGVTTNIYLGSTQTVRAIKKYVITGNENWRASSAFAGGFFCNNLLQPCASMEAVCSHFENTSSTATYSAGQFVLGGTDNVNVNMRQSNTSWTADDFKTYLAAQYAAGTPVTVWYVLKTAETAAVNEPLMKIGTYADTLSNAASIPTTEGANSITVDTTVQPSEFTATWTGWHNASVKEWDGQNWT